MVMFMVDGAGNITRLGTGDMPLEVIETWQSPLGSVYPIEWRAQITPLGETIIIKAVFPEQELNLSTRYWEGAIDIYGEGKTTEAIGVGYLEMTGY